MLMWAHHRFASRGRKSLLNPRDVEAAAMAANAQGKFWQMHDLIIANPQKVARQDLVSYAQRIGLMCHSFKRS